MKRKRKSALQKRKDDPRSKYWCRKADNLWSGIIHALYPTCAVNDIDCKDDPQAHHLIPRTHRATRHDVENGICLCSLHHEYSPRLSPHYGPVGFAAWLQANEREKWEYVLAHKYEIGKVDYKSAYARLVATAQRLGVAQEEK